MSAKLQNYIFKSGIHKKCTFISVRPSLGFRLGLGLDYGLGFRLGLH